MIKSKFENLKNGANELQPGSFMRAAFLSMSCFALWMFVHAGFVHADGGAFDLAGPPVPVMALLPRSNLPFGLPFFSDTVEHLLSA